MNDDENLGSFTTPESGTSNGSGIFIPTAIALAGVLIGGIALYLAFAGSGRSDEAKAAIDAATSQTSALETRIAELEQKINATTTESAAVDSRLRTMAGQTQSALNQVGQEMNNNRKQLQTIAEKVQEISEKLAKANSPAPTRAPPGASATPATASSGPADSAGSAAPQSHTIASGETFARLASKYNVTVDAILSANPDVDPRRLQVGQKIKIPTSAQQREE